MKSLRKEVCPTPNYTIKDDRIKYVCSEGKSRRAIRFFCLHLLQKCFITGDALVLKKNQAHRWRTLDYTRLKGKKTLEDLMDGIKDSFVAHYFGSKYDNGKLKLKSSSPLIGIMEEHCPAAAQIIKNGIE